MVKMSFGYLAQRLKDTFDIYKYENIHRAIKMETKVYKV